MSISSITGMGPGFDAYIMNSAANVNTVVTDFERALTAGMDPNDLLSDIIKKHNLTRSDFTDRDFIKLTNRLEAICETMGGNHVH